LALIVERLKEGVLCTDCRGVSFGVLGMWEMKRVLLISTSASSKDCSMEASSSYVTLVPSSEVAILPVS
jgi:hypothetical protein